MEVNSMRLGGCILVPGTRRGCLRASGPLAKPGRAGVEFQSRGERAADTKRLDPVRRTAMLFRPRKTNTPKRSVAAAALLVAAASLALVGCSRAERRSSSVSQ